MSPDVLWFIRAICDRLLKDEKMAIKAKDIRNANLELERRLIVETVTEFAQRMLVDYDDRALVELRMRYEIPRFYSPQEPGNRYELTKEPIKTHLHATNRPNAILYSLGYLIPNIQETYCFKDTIARPLPTCGDVYCRNVVCAIQGMLLEYENEFQAFTQREDYATSQLFAAFRRMCNYARNPLPSNPPYFKCESDRIALYNLIDAMYDFILILYDITDGLHPSLAAIDALTWGNVEKSCRPYVAFIHFFKPSGLHESTIRFLHDKESPSPIHAAVEKDYLYYCGEKLDCLRVSPHVVVRPKDHIPVDLLHEWLTKNLHNLPVESKLFAKKTEPIRRDIITFADQYPWRSLPKADQSAELAILHAVLFKAAAKVISVDAATADDHRKAANMYRKAVEILKEYESWHGSMEKYLQEYEKQRGIKTKQYLKSFIYDMYMDEGVSHMNCMGKVNDTREKQAAAQSALQAFDAARSHTSGNAVHDAAVYLHVAKTCAYMRAMTSNVDATVAASYLEKGRANFKAACSALERIGESVPIEVTKIVYQEYTLLIATVDYSDLPSDMVEGNINKKEEISHENPKSCARQTVR